MTSPYAMGRLLWRPSAFGLLFMVTLASSVALTLPNWGEPLTFGSDSLTDLLFGPALWRLALVLPFAVGVASSMVVNEARHTASAWMLPGYGPSLLYGTTVTAAVIAALVGTLAVMTRGVIPGVAAFGIATVGFSLGSFVADPLTPTARSRATLAILAILVIRPDYLQGVAEWQPLSLAPAAGLIAFLLLRREFSPELARRRPFVHATVLASTSSQSMRSYWAGKPALDSEWRGPLWTNRVSSWLRAAHYETFGGRSRGFLTVTVLQFLFIGVFAYSLGEPSMVVYIPAIGASMGGYYLSGRFLYPLTRRDRAMVMYTASLLRMATIFALATITVAALYSLGVRVEPGRPVQSLPDAILLVLFFVAWAPVGQLGNMSGRRMDDLVVSVRQALVTFALLIGWMTLAMQSHEAYAQAEPIAALPYATRLALIGVLIAITQTAYWYALQWYYARRDIAFLPAG